MATPDGHMAPFFEASLPLVDPYEDHDNVWVMLDEGCNSTCHTPPRSSPSTG